MASSVKEQVQLQAGAVGRTLSSPPSQPVTPAPETPHPPVLATYPNVAEQAVNRLSEAAQRIAEVEPANRRLPHASRLAPFRDISAEIRRESTPLPKFSRMRSKTGPHEKADTPTALQAIRPDASEQGNALLEGGAAMPDLWPWLDGETEEKENEDTWANSTDPLISRHIPNSVEAAHIEAEDIRRALAEGISTNHLPARRNSMYRVRRLRIAFAILAILAVLALVVDGVLVSVVFVHPRRPLSPQPGLSAATLTLTPNVVNVTSTAQTPQLHIVNFAPGTSVLLSHDIQESVKTSSGSSLVNIGPNGSANATIVVGSDWGPGFHLVVAEDVTTRYTASATLQVISSTPTKPAHLLIAGLDKNTLDFGTNIVGANTVTQLHLSNSGSGSITWSASSHQSWLLISPSQGMFSQGQIIDVAVQRANLKSGHYSGSITLFSSVDPPRTIQVTMSVQNLPSNVGPVLALSPAVLSFTATDGLPAPAAQELMLSNPGTQTLNWSLSSNSSATQSTQVSVSNVLGANGGWLSISQLSGSIPARSTQPLYVLVQSANLLPGTYLGSLLFTATPGAADSPQTVGVSLTVQPHCGLVTNQGNFQFTAVQGKTNPVNQTLGINETASCAGLAINWKAALSSPTWLSVSPASGQLKGTASQFLSVGVNATGLAPSKTPYSGIIAFTTLQSTQTVLVQLIVQPQPASAEPIMSVSQLNVNFSNTQGQPDPKGQAVTITNNGQGLLNWSTSVNQIVTTWLNVYPQGGSVQPGQSVQLVVSVHTAQLTPGTYSGQITLNGTDNAGNPASGSPQVVSINLVIQPPCTLTQPSYSSVAFTAVQGGLNPVSQNLLITGTGNCTWPLLWSASVPPNAPWLTITPMTGSIKGSGQPASFMVSANIAGLTADVYTTQVTISATDSAGLAAQSSPQVFSVALTVQPPCTIVSRTAPLSFTVAQNQASSSVLPQNVLLNETGTCSRPVTWTTVGNAGSSAWLGVTTPAPDTGNGSTLSVTVNPGSLQPGSYTGSIKVSAVDSNGAAVSGTQTITVNLNVTATISGTVMACATPAPPCLVSTPLPGATLTLLNSSGATVTTTTADGSGNYTFLGLAPGNYTVNASGTDSANIHYSTTGIPFPVSSSATGVILQVYPG